MAFQASIILALLVPFTSACDVMSYSMERPIVIPGDVGPVDHTMGPVVPLHISTKSVFRAEEGRGAIVLVTSTRFRALTMVSP